jgi:hypothetical protein
MRHQPELPGIFSKGGAMCNKLLRRKAASDYLRETHGVPRAPATLAKLAVIGGGPIFRRAGRVPLYSTDDLDLWVASILSPPMRSTSDIEQVSSYIAQNGGQIAGAESNARRVIS